MKKKEILFLALFSIAMVLSLIVPATVGASITVPRLDDLEAALAIALSTPQGNVTPMVATGGWHTVGLKSDGTVVSLGDNNNGQCGVGGWKDIIQVVAGWGHTVGLKSDGTVVAVGSNDKGQCDAGNWTDTIQVAAGGKHTVGLRSDGTVVAVGYDEAGQCEIGDWTNIVQLAAAYYQTVGLKSDGTVIATGYNYDGQCDVGNWTDIIQVAAGDYHTVGLKSDGTVIAVGDNNNNECDVGGWTDIVQVAAGSYHTVGLKGDGIVMAAGSGGGCDVDGWTDIVEVAAGGELTVGLKSDGTVVAVGNNDSGQCEVVGWNLVLALPKSQCFLATSSTLGGSVTSPGEGTFAYDQGTMVDLVAEPEENYGFVGWTGDVDTVANLNADQTTIIMEDSYSITANFELEEGLSSLTISSTSGGSVVTHGEGIFVYDQGTVVNLVAEPDEGYRFVNWTGDVGTIGNVTAAVTNITMDNNYSVMANFVDIGAGNVGIRAGDWIKLDYKISGWPAGQPYPEWLRLEFLSVEGTSVTTQATMHMSDGTEQSDTVPVDIVTGGGETIGFSGGVVSANLTTGDSIYMTGYGDIPIKGEATRIYAGARRTVIYVSISQSVPVQGEVRLTYYWDKLTGVLVESSTTSAGITGTAKAIETNMWEPTTGGMQRWPWIIVAAAVVGVGLAIFFIRRKRSAQIKEAPD